jgi:Tfp pilus assembly protein PilW
LAKTQARTGDERGMTLVELMIAFLLTTILCVTAMSATSALVRDATNANTRIRLNSEAQLVMDGISRQVRAATYAANGYPSLEPVAYASANEITFYASLLPNSLGSGPVKFDVTATGSDLVETTWQPDTGSGGSGWTYTTPGVAQTLATDVDPSHVLFTYYGCPPLEQQCVQVDPLTDPGANLPVPMTQQDADSAGGTGMIHAVVIDLWLDPNGAGNGPFVEVTTTVHLINVDFSNPLTS